MSDTPTQPTISESEYRFFLDCGWKLWSAVYDADAASLILRRGPESLAVSVPGLKPDGPPTPQREEPRQTPGNLPPGATLDSLLTVEQWAKWRGYSVRYAEDIVRRKSFKGAIREGHGSPVRILPRAYLAGLGKGFKEAL